MPLKWTENNPPYHIFQTRSIWIFTTAFIQKYIPSTMDTTSLLLLPVKGKVGIHSVESNLRLGTHFTCLNIDI